ncbi:MAG: hypothetical protein AB7I45_01555 [Planctomycetota bacterium]
MSDVAATLAEVPGPGGRPAAEPRGGIWGWLSERLNPILVREVHQALNGRVFLFTAGLAFLAVFVIALLIAANDEASPRAGAEAFLNTLYVLVPILLFIVPLQAFFSTRSEVGGGTVEHLLLSRLRPAQIVRGKLISTTVQFVLYLAIFAPLLALTYLLRGVDIPTIAWVLAMAFLLALASSSLAIACGALCRWRAAFRVLPFAIVLLGLGWLTVTVLGALPFGLMSARFLFDADAPVSAIFAVAGPPLLSTILFALIGSSALAHPYENRSTGFRAFALLMVLLALGWTVFTYDQMSPSIRPYITLATSLNGIVTTCGVMLGLFPFFAATEPPRLSPRVQRHVPRSPLLAFLVSPLLPGNGRGLLFALLLTAIALGGTVLLPELWGEVSKGGSDRMQEITVGIWLYVVLFSALGCAVRGRLAAPDTRNWWARGLLPLLMMLSALVPLLVGVVGSSRSVMLRWSPLQLFNPFASLSYVRHDDDVMVWLGAATGVAVVINLAAMVRGVSEVMEASRQRRRRAP